jgi:hypothetical protein
MKSSDPVDLFQPRVPGVMNPDPAHPPPHLVVCPGGYSCTHYTILQQTNNIERG